MMTSIFPAEQRGTAFGIQVTVGGLFMSMGPLLGGVFTEILKDVSFRRAPVSVDTARGMIDDLKGAALLKGARGSEPADLDALCEAISHLSVFAAAHAEGIESIEINPLRALPSGCIGLDALIVKRASNS